MTNLVGDDSQNVREMAAALEREVARRQELEIQLEAANARWQKTFDAVQDMIWMLDADRRIIAANQATRLLLDRPPADLLGRHCCTEIHGRAEEVAGCPVTRAFQTRQRQVAEIPWGDRWLEVTADPVLDDRGGITGMIHLVREVTGRHRADEEKRRLQSQLHQAQKLESIGRLAGGVAHDFNNMLGVILGHAELAREQIEPAHPLQTALAEIVAAARRSADLARQLLAFARRQTVSPRRIDLNEAVAGILTMVGRLVGEDIRLEWRPGPDLHGIFIDPSQIDQILTNLAANARDAIAGQGRIIIETRNVVLDREACVALGELSPGDHVLLRFQDDGAGMPPEVLDHVFEPFFTTKALGCGTGLGLATVYGIVRQSHGAIRVDSHPGKGTVFHIYWPGLAAGPGRKASPAVASPAAPPAGRALVLLVEDEPAILRMTQRMLEQLGYRVLATTMPAEAVRMAEANPGRISLLVTDLVMPDQTGQELARQIGPTQPGMRCLFMSGYFDGDSIRHRIQGEDVRFLQKPFTIAELAASLRAALDA